MQAPIDQIAWRLRLPRARRKDEIDFGCWTRKPPSLQFSDELRRQGIPRLSPAEALIALDYEVQLVAYSERDILPSSIAVLPCDNLSPDPDNAYFALSLHEEILNQLFKLRELSVIARTSVMQYENVARPISEIADELRVESVMECSVSYGDDRVAISAQLVDGATGVHLWSERYNREFRDIFGIQADIATNIANALELAFSSGEQEDIAREPTDSPEAYAVYLRAKSGTLAERHSLLDEALVLDPNFALAHGAKSWLYSQELTSTRFGASIGPTGRAQLEEQVRRHARRALELDADIGAAHAALASYHFFYWCWTEARREFEAAFRTVPGDAGMLVPYVFLNSYVGDHEYAVRLAQRLTRLNPNDLYTFAVLGLAQSFAGNLEEAARNFQIVAVASDSMAVREPVSAWVVWLEIARGNYEEALRQLDIATEAEREGLLFPTGTAHLYALLGRADYAEGVLAQIQAAARDGRPVGAGEWAQIFLAVGEIDQALEWLEVAAEKARNHEPDEGFYSLMALKMNVHADPVLDRPEFVDALNRITGD